MRSLRSSGPLCAVLSLSMLACGDDDVPPVPPGGRDAQVTMDAQTPGDGGAPDATGIDASEPDGAIDVDGGLTDCAHDELELASIAATTRERVALAAGSDELLVGWVERAEGFLVPHWALAPSTGDAEPVTGFAPIRGASGGLAAIRSGDGYLLGFHANPAGDNELYGLAIDGAGAASGMPVRWTNHAGADDRLGLLASDGGTLVTWMQGEPGVAARIARSGWVNASGTMPSEPSTFASGEEVPLEVSLAPTDAGALVGWARAGASGADAVVRPLDARGAPSGGALAVSTESNAVGAVDVSADDGGALVVFGAVAGGGVGQVRARRVSSDGTSEGAEQIVADGSDGAGLRYGGVYAVALRERTDTETRLALVFLDPALNVVGHVDLGPAASEGSVRIALAGDGRLGIARIDVDVDAPRTRVLLTRVDCVAD